MNTNDKKNLGISGHHYRPGESSFGTERENRTNHEQYGNNGSVKTDSEVEDHSPSPRDMPRKMSPIRFRVAEKIEPKDLKTQPKETLQNPANG